MSFKDLVKMEGGFYYIDFDTPLDDGGEWHGSDEVIRSAPFNARCDCGRAREAVMNVQPGVIHITFECPVCEKHS